MKQYNHNSPVCLFSSDLDAPVCIIKKTDGQKANSTEANSLSRVEQVTVPPVPLCFLIRRNPTSSSTAAIKKATATHSRKKPLLERESAVRGSSVGGVEVTEMGFAIKILHMEHFSSF